MEHGERTLQMSHAEIILSIVTCVACDEVNAVRRTRRMDHDVQR